MVKISRLFGQLLQHFSRTQFAELVNKHGAERHAKGFTGWSRFMAMMFFQLVHFGLPKGPNKPTLAAMIRLNLFSYRHLLEWLHHPFSTDPLLPATPQLSFPLLGLGQPRA